MAKNWRTSVSGVCRDRDVADVVSKSGRAGIAARRGRIAGELQCKARCARQAWEPEANSELLVVRDRVRRFWPNGDHSIVHAGLEHADGGRDGTSRRSEPPAGPLVVRLAEAGQRVSGYVTLTPFQAAPQAMRAGRWPCAGNRRWCGMWCAGPWYPWQRGPSRLFAVAVAVGERRHVEWGRMARSGGVVSQDNGGRSRRKRGRRDRRRGAGHTAAHRAAWRRSRAAARRVGTSTGTVRPVVGGPPGGGYGDPVAD